MVELARHNARIYGVENKIEFVVGDFFQLVPYLKPMEELLISFGKYQYAFKATMPKQQQNQEDSRPRLSQADIIKESTSWSQRYDDEGTVGITELPSERNVASDPPEGRSLKLVVCLLCMEMEACLHSLEPDSKTRQVGTCMLFQDLMLLCR
ncbi:hypothetical protein ZWY2020_040971 [Hordeum vulgare]|nr:hypothetical protein ZWY2020_040971 [Hordeum vulgare]